MKTFNTNIYNPISYSLEDLRSYVEGKLSTEMARRIELYLQQEEMDREYVEDYRAFIGKGGVYQAEIETNFEANAARLQVYMDKNKWKYGWIYYWESIKEGVMAFWGFIAEIVKFTFWDRKIALTAFSLMFCIGFIVKLGEDSTTPLPIEISLHETRSDKKNTSPQSNTNPAKSVIPSPTHNHQSAKQPTVSVPPKPSNEVESNEQLKLNEPTVSLTPKSDNEVAIKLELSNSNFNDTPKDELVIRPIDFTKHNSIIISGNGSGKEYNGDVVIPAGPIEKRPQEKPDSIPFEDIILPRLEDLLRKL